MDYFGILVFVIIFMYNSCCIDYNVKYTNDISGYYANKKLKKETRILINEVRKSFPNLKHKRINIYFDDSESSPASIYLGKKSSDIVLGIQNGYFNNLSKSEKKFAIAHELGHYEQYLSEYMMPIVHDGFEFTFLNYIINFHPFNSSFKSKIIHHYLMYNMTILIYCIYSHIIFNDPILQFKNITIYNNTTIYNTTAIYNTTNIYNDIKYDDLAICFSILLEYANIVWLSNLLIFVVILSIFYILRLQEYDADIKAVKALKTKNGGISFFERYNNDNIHENNFNENNFHDINFNNCCDKKNNDKNKYKKNNCVFECFKKYIYNFFETHPLDNERINNILLHDLINR